MSSNKAFHQLVKKGYPVDSCPYNRNDSLESNDDLMYLFQVLDQVRDINGKPPVITANNIVANPDFTRIKESGYSSYFHEPFTKTLERYPAHDQVLTLYRQGMKAGFIQPQFHGREHLNVARWMEALQRNDTPVRTVFDLEMYSPHVSDHPVYKMEYMDAFNFIQESELSNLAVIIQQGLDLFYDIWGFKSKSFIAPCYIWGKELEAQLSNNGISYIQGIRNQFQPILGSTQDTRNVYHYLGERNRHNQRYLVRNAFFEPSINPDVDWVSECLKRISSAFAWKKPAIIGSHRLNFMGQLNPKNREENLLLLSKLLKKIKENWPDVEFMSSDELGIEIDKINLEK
tara:strand:+ start:18544 stop:19575 length:1032 start_codon:yes stop_codon:yes gene_type:complete